MQICQDNISAKVNGVLAPILGVKVTVTDAATGNPAVVYSDNGVTQLAQPLVTDETGYFGFYAANGEYELKFESAQIKLAPRKVKLYDPTDDQPLTQAQAAAASGASKIGFIARGNNAVSRSLENKMQDLPVGINDRQTQASLIADRHIAVPTGTFPVPAKVDFQPNPVTLRGSASGSFLSIDDAISKTAFRFGAVGANDRQITKLADLSFVSTVGPATAIDAQSVHPLFLDTQRFYQLGGKAVKLKNLYYGRSQNHVFRDSGFDLNDVNNYSFDGGDFGGIPNSTNYGAADYACTMVDSDSISLHNATIEGWRNPFLSITRGKNVSLNSMWLEANTGTHILMLKCAAGFSMNDCFQDLYPSPSQAIVKVDNSGIIGPPRAIITPINVIGGLIRLTVDPVAAVPYVDAAPGSKAVVPVYGATIDRGHLFGRGDVQFNMRSVTLSSSDSITDEVKSLYSIPNAHCIGPYNSWVSDSVQADWDFAGGTGLTEVGTSVLTMATTTTAKEYLTGTRGIKVSGIPSNSTRYVIRKLMSDMGAATAEGQSHLIFVRFKPSADMSIIFAIEGFYIEYERSPDITFKAGRWCDFVLKTASDNTWAQGRQGSPKLLIKVNNASGAAANLFIDRLDYQTVQGDVHLP